MEYGAKIKLECTFLRPGVNPGSRHKGSLSWKTVTKQTCRRRKEIQRFRAHTTQRWGHVFAQFVVFLTKSKESVVEVIT